MSEKQSVGNENSDDCDSNNQTVQLSNEHLAKLPKDYLYHLSLGTDNGLKELFGDVKFVCMGGTGERMLTFAKYIQKELGLNTSPSEELHDYSAASYRFALYKVGPVLAVSHGMGMSSISILLHEIVKLVHYARCVDPVFIRIGTCGGVGVEAGTVVVTDKAFDGVLQQSHEFTVVGKRIRRPAIFNQNLANEIVSHARTDDAFETILGGTMGADDFYEAQGRVDGAICEHTEADKSEFLNKLYSIGVRNIEMESVLFGAFTHYTKIKGAIVCVAFLNRLNGDQVQVPKPTLAQWQLRPQIIVGRYIKSTLNRLK